MSLAFAITGDIIPPRERARYQGYFAATMALSSVLGPVAGGFFAGLPELLGIVGWRWVFWINIPVGIVALVIVAKTLHVDQNPKRPRIDYLGAVLLAVAIVPALLVGEQGSAWGWLSAGSISCYLIAGAGVVLFIVRQARMGADALLPFAMFRNRAFSIPTALAFTLGLLQLGGIAAIPLYLQIAHGTGPTQAGLLMLPMVLGIAGASTLAGRYTSRTGHYKVLPIIGMSLLVIAFLGLATVTANTSLILVDLWMLLLGLGVGAAMNTTILAMQNVVEPTQMGIATASGTFFRNLGGTAGTAVLLSVLFSQATTSVASAYQEAAGTASYQAAVTAHPAQARALQDGLVAGLSDTSFLHGLNHVLAAPFLNGFAHAMNVTSIIAAGIAVAGLILAALMREVPLRSKSGLAARQATTASTAASTASQPAS